MYITFDTEFTGLHKNTELISIGLVDEFGRSFYAEFNDYNKSQCEGNEFLQKEVIGNLLMNDYDEIFREGKNHVSMKSDKNTISKYLMKWLGKYDKVQFVSDVSHYDFVLLIDLLTNGGCALDLPKQISPVCRDINHDIAFYFNKTDAVAFDMSREEILTDYFEMDIDDSAKHNSLYDAKIIRFIFDKIRMY